jgi:PHD/YefM family antitoxin component YafN of YafNO toxin-antitoxin module
MNIVPAQEIKRRGIAAVDEALAQGPVHIVKNNRAQYVVLTEARYQELLEMQEESRPRPRQGIPGRRQGRPHHPAPQRGCALEASGQIR